MTTRILKLPPSMGGIALGSVGLGGTLRLVAEVYLNGTIILNDVMAIPLYILSTIYVGIMFFRMCLLWKNNDLVNTESREPPSLSAYGALVLACVLLSQAVASISNDTWYYYLGLVGIYTSAVFQLLLMVWFLYICHATKSPPEPFWFPVTVSFAMTALVGDTVNAPVVLMEISFWGGIALTVLILPVVIYRTLRDPNQVAANPTIAILQAPASFVAVTWFAMDGSDWIGANGVGGNVADDVMAIALSTTSMTVFLLTLYGIWRRRHYVFNEFSGAWASFTFPTISTVRTAVLFAERYNTDGQALPLQVWAIALCVSWLPFVLVVILVFTFYAIFRPQGLSQTTTSRKNETSDVDDNEDGGNSRDTVEDVTSTTPPPLVDPPDASGLRS